MSQDNIISDDSDLLESYSKELNNGYSVNCDIEEFGSDRVRLITCSIIKDEKEVGYCEAFIIDRDGFDNFYVDCDGVDESLKFISTTLFHEKGRLRRDMWLMFSEKQIQYSSSGGFLSIYMIKIKKEHRGYDLGFECLSFMMNCIKGQWTLSVVELNYFHKSYKEHKKLQIYQFFARFGYIPNQVKYLDYWFLIPKKLMQISKSSGRNIHYYPVLKSIRPLVLSSQIDRLLLSACLEQTFCKEKDGRIRKLLRTSILNGLDIDGSGILIIAARRCLPNLVEALLDEKANINVKNELSETPLHAACKAGNVKCIELLLKCPGCKLNAQDSYNETPFQIYLFYLSSLFISDVFDSLNISDKSDRISKYSLCMNLMPPETKKLLVEKVMTPRMFKRLNYTTTFYSDMAIDDLEFTDFKSNQKISVSQLLEISLMDCIPSDIIKKGVYRGFVQGFVDILAVISVIMSHGEQLPTVNHVLKLCQSKCHRSFKYFLDNGGRVKHILKGIIDCVADASWECGDNSEAEDDDDSLPKFRGLDGNFDFLKSFVLDFLVQN